VAQARAYPVKLNLKLFYFPTDTL